MYCKQNKVKKFIALLIGIAIGSVLGILYTIIKCCDLKQSIIIIPIVEEMISDIKDEQFEMLTQNRDIRINDGEKKSI